MVDGTAIFARALGSTEPKDDVIMAWNYMGCMVFLLYVIIYWPQRSQRLCNEDAILELKRVRDKILGRSEEMTPDAPKSSSSGELTGGTHFERLGQTGVKNTRCFSMTLSHQHPNNRVGPTAGSKVYNHKLSENESIRRETVKVWFLNMSRLTH